MITTSILPTPVHLRKNRLSASFFIACVFLHTLFLLSTERSWFKVSNRQTKPIFSGITTCHSFSIQHRWSATSPLSRRSRQVRLAELHPNSSDSGKDGPPRENNFSNSSVAEIQQYVMKKGLAFVQTSFEEEPSMTLIPGCVATVNVFAKRKDHDDDVDTTTNRISLYGNSDAIFSRGLLSLLKDYVEELTIDQILRLKPIEIADTLGVRSALSKGRNDGLANMVTVIQQQLKETTHDDYDLSETTSTIKVTNSTTMSSLPSVESKPKVALLLSGGVDSSVAFRLLLEQGYDVTPYYLKIWLEDELAHLGECPWEDDVKTCRQVCDQVGIDLQIIGLQDEYQQRVMQHTLNEASLGRTPNPDILCNSRVKFGCFLEYLEGLPNQFDYIASGHYAQVRRAENDIEGNDKNVNGIGGDSTSIARLFRAPDPVKDQSYFLCALDQSQLSRLLFPIGHLEKTEVRQLADDFQLPNRHRPDSQGLCFLGKVKFRDFMQIHLGKQVGDIIDAVTGEIIGQHHGVWYHTVGQRKGIGPYLLPKSTAFGPWYVVAKDPSRNIVYASNKYDEDVFRQARSEFHVENLHWISGKEPTHLLDEANEGKYRFILKIRHGPRLAAGTLEVLTAAENDTNQNTNRRHEGIIKLDEKDGGLAPGQYVVFYTEDLECLGSGIISERHWAKFLLGRQPSNEGETAAKEAK